MAAANAIRFKSSDGDVITANDKIRTHSPGLDAMIKEQIVDDNDTVDVKDVGTFALKKIIEWCTLLSAPVPTDPNAKRARDRKILKWLFRILERETIPNIDALAMASYHLQMSDLVDSCSTILSYRSNHETNGEAMEAYVKLQRVHREADEAAKAAQEAEAKAKAEAEEGEPKDGTDEGEPKDGTEEGEPKDGTEEGEPKDGTEECKPEDGTKECKPEDGTEEGEPKDGTEECKPKDGTEEGEPKDGTEECKPKDGTEEGDQKDGTEETNVGTTPQPEADQQADQNHC